MDFTLTNTVAASRQGHPPSTNKQSRYYDGGSGRLGTYVRLCGRDGGILVQTQTDWKTKSLLSNIQTHTEMK